MKKIKLILSVLFGTLFAFLMVSCGEKPHVHNLVEHDRKDATCIEDGYEAYVECTTCDYTTYKEIAKKAHDYKWVIDKEATEDETGLKHEECSVCHDKKNENTIIVKLNHTHNMEHVLKIDKTCTKDGNIEYYHCSKCNKNYLDETGNNEVVDVVIKASHEYGNFINEVASTCSKEGTKGHYECSVCHNYFDANKNKLDSLVIAKKNHDYKANYSYNESKHYYECKNCGAIKGEEDHSFTWIVDKEATEEETGLKHEECNVCHYTKNENTVIDKLDHIHNMEHVLKVEKTCTSDGNIEYYHCIKCKKNYLDASGNNEVVDVIIKASHEYGNYINGVDSTCSKEGTKGHYECNACHSYFDANKKQLNSIIINKKSHSLVHHDKKEATCTSDGYEAYDTCRNCDYTTYRKIEKKPHEYSSTIKTINKETYLHYQCNNCTDSYDENCKVESSNEFDFDFENGSNVVLKNSYRNSITSIDLKGKITISDNCTWIVSKDVYGFETYKTKVIPLNEGNNNFYIIVSFNDNDEIFTTYNLNIYRNHLYTYSFYNEDNVVLSNTIEEGETINEAPLVSKYECSLLGWKDDNNNDIEFPYTIRNNVSFYANWKINEYMVVFDTDGGNIVESMSIPYGTTLNLPTPIKGNDTFVGWEYDNKLYSRIKVIDDITFIAIWAHDFIINIINEEVGIVRYIGNDENVTLPKYASYIMDNAFTGCGNLVNIEIPNGVTSIGDSAFLDCINLINIEIPSSVKSIERSAFRGCSSLTNIKVDSNNKVYDSRENCNAIIYTSTNTLVIGCGSTTIPKSVTSIEDFAFYNCSSLASIEIPNSITSIGSNAFSGCSSLTNVEISNSVISIGNSAFMGCTSLTSIEIPSSVTNIENSAFHNCSSLTNIKVDSNNKIYDSRENCNAIIETSTNTLIIGCGSTTIPNSVTSIENYAFRGCSSLTSIKIPNSVTNIGGSAFSECSSLTNIKVDSSNKVYDSRENCNAIIETSTNILIQGCKSTVVPNNVTSIREYAFNGCSGLTSIIIPNSVTSIGTGAFSSCSSLTSIIIPNSVTSIGKYAFYNCSSLTNIKVDSSNKVYDNRENCNAIIETSTNILIQGCKSTVIPNSVTSIGEHAFNGCSNLTSITIPNSVTSIGYCAFKDCSSLTNIEIPNSVTSIGMWAFEYCSSLTNIEIPKSVDTIGSYAFYCCNSLEKVELLSDSIKTIKIGTGAFAKCENLISVNATKNVLSIGDAAFNSCTNLVSFEVLGGVYSIGKSAFAYCINLTNMKMLEHCSEIGNRAFSSCYNLANIDIPNSVTSIEDSAFSNCRNLKNIKIPKSVWKMQNNVFESCRQLTIYCEVESKPDNWLDYWNSSNCDVIWNYKEN